MQGPGLHLPTVSHSRYANCSMPHRQTADHDAEGARDLPDTSSLRLRAAPELCGRVAWLSQAPDGQAPRRDAKRGPARVRRLPPRLQYPIDRRAADLEGLGDLRGSKPLRLHFAHLGGIYRRRAALVDTFDLGLGDALKLPLAA